MRGGIFVHNYDINKPDFIKFLKLRNKTIYHSMVDALDQLNEKAAIGELINFGENQKDPSLLLGYVTSTYHSHLVEGMVTQVGLGMNLT